jgi:hypothetical protein
MTLVWFVVWLIANNIGDHGACSLTHLTFGRQH